MKFVRDKSHCRHESYTKTEINSLLENKADATNTFEKGDIAVIEYDLAVIQVGNGNTQWQGTDYIAMPENFSKDNSCIVGIMCAEKREGGDGEYHTPYNWVLDNSVVTQVNLSFLKSISFPDNPEKNIDGNAIRIFGNYYGGAITGIKIKFVIMKAE